MSPSTTFHASPFRTVLSQAPFVVSRDAASTVEWARILCGPHHAFDPSVPLIRTDPTAPPLTFREDGTATWGDRVFPWQTSLWLLNSNRSTRVWAAKLLDPARVERQRWRLVQREKVALADLMAAISLLRTAGPICGTARTRRGETWLCCRPGERRGSASISFGSAQGDEVERNDLAHLWYTVENRFSRAAGALAVATELLRVTLLRHLPSEAPRGAQVRADLGGRTYWLQGIEGKWEWLATPESEPIHLTFGGSP